MKSCLLILISLTALQLIGAVRPSVRVDAFDTRIEVQDNRADAQAFRAHLLELLCATDAADFSDAESREAALRERDLILAGMTEKDLSELKRFRPATLSLYGALLHASVRQELVGGVVTPVGLFEVQVVLAEIESGKVLVAKTVNGKAYGEPGITDKLLERAMRDAVRRAAGVISDALQAKADADPA